jgi:hypothetical protein
MAISLGQVCGETITQGEDLRSQISEKNLMSEI